MSLKICKECQFHDKQVFDTPQGPAYLDVCRHEDCRDVVTGGIIPAAAARQQEVFCGFKARFYEEVTNKPEDAKIIQLIEKK